MCVFQTHLNVFREFHTREVLAWVSVWYVSFHTSDKSPCIYGGAHDIRNQDVVWCVKIGGMYGCLGPSWALITYIICLPGTE